MGIRKICLLEKKINVVYNVIAEDIFQFILYSYFTSHKTIIQEISRILNPAFFIIDLSHKSVEYAKHRKHKTTRYMNEEIKVVQKNTDPI